MKSACATDPENPAQSLIQQVCYPHLHEFRNTTLKWGCSHEGAIITAYTEFMKTRHSDFKCSKNGVFISEEYPFIEASPDGMICSGAGVLEVKCPYCIRMEDPDKATCLESEKLSTQHAYYYQIQLQMFVCSVDHADFVIGTFQESKPSLHILGLCDNDDNSIIVHLYKNSITMIEHVGNPLEDVTEDCFVSEPISDVGEESDDNDADDDKTTTDWIDERTNESNGGSSSASSSSSSSGVITEFLPLEKAKSIVWNYFGFPARSGKFVQKDKRLRKEVYCKVCQRPLSYKGNTTNMIVHLQSHHSAVYSEIADQLKTGNAHSSLASLPKDQLSIRDSFKN